MIPVITNDQNHIQWPGVVSQDVMKHTGGLKGDVFVLSGQVKGKTLLPLPPQAETATEAVENGWGICVCVCVCVCVCACIIVTIVV